MSFEMKDILINSMVATSVSNFGEQSMIGGGPSVIPPGCPSSYIKVGIENEVLGPII